jgi:hypothetical protein
VKRLLEALRSILRPAKPPAPAGDDLEPYCSELTLQQRRIQAGSLDASTAKAIHKVGARYGADL